MAAFLFRGVLVSMAALGHLTISNSSLPSRSKSAAGRKAEHAGTVRPLTAAERAELRRDMAEASAWMRGELARRRAMNK